ncbi:FG-GAP-like repeat-containing protein [Thalassotalea piscium]|uniref:FG-GAP-like repeat-containing protein n=1 Tax=Thalassotalea piscium TaxID=1230533 RepID=UPI0025739F39|nr:FG-GAP-like repeat-containing protein [Thalassotalea piscium]
MLLVFLIFTVSAHATLSLIKNIEQGDQLQLTPLGEMGNNVYFSIDTKEYGEELWFYNGHSISLFKDIFPGSSSSRPTNFVVVNNKFYFKVGACCGYGEVWQSDGTPTGTRKIYNIPSGFDFNSLIPLGNKLLIHGKSYSNYKDQILELKSDGTTVLIDEKDSIKNITLINGGIAYSQYSSATGNEMSFIDSSGVVYDFDLNTGSDGSDANDFVWLNSLLYVVGNENLWQINLNNQQVSVVKTFAGNISQIVSLNNKLCVFTSESYSKKMWQSDGTDNGTTMEGNYEPDNLFVGKNEIFFTKKRQYSWNSTILYRSDCTSSSTIKIKDVYDEDYNIHTDYNWLIFPEFHQVIDDLLYFTNNTAVTGGELWQVNLSNNTVSLYKDNLVGAGSSHPGNFYNSSKGLFYTATELSGQKLYLLSGEGLKSFTINTGYDLGSSPTYIGEYLNKELFIIKTVEFGDELWVLDQSKQLTLLDEINEGTGNSEIRYLGKFNNDFYIQAFDLVNGYAIWKVDLSNNSVGIVFKSDTVKTNKWVQDFAVVSEGFYFILEEKIGWGLELWFSDGKSPPKLIKNKGTPTSLNVVNDVLYFSADGTNESDYWVNRLWSVIVDNGKITINELNKDFYGDVYALSESKLLNVDNNTLNIFNILSNTKTDAKSFCVSDCYSSLITPLKALTNDHIHEYPDKFYFVADNQSFEPSLWKLNKSNLAISVIPNVVLSNDCKSRMDVVPFDDEILFFCTYNIYKYNLNTKVFTQVESVETSIEVKGVVGNSVYYVVSMNYYKIQNGENNVTQLGELSWMDDFIADGLHGTYIMTDSYMGRELWSYIDDVDSDGDGLSDEFELAYGLNPLDASDALSDSDGDGFTNLEEFTLGTNPTLADTDGDGVLDGDDLSPLVSLADNRGVDFNNNGLADILLRNESTGQWYLYGINTDLSLASWGGVGLTTDSNWTVQDIGHLNNDVNADVLVRHDNGHWYQFTLDGNRSVTGDVGFIGQLPQSKDFEFKGLQDFDNDGLSDVLVRNSTNGSWWLYRLDGAKGVASYRSLGVTTNQDWVFEGLSDLNNDGYVDVLLRHNTNGAWYVNHLDANGDVLSSSGGLGVSRNSDWQVKRLVDMNSDGVVDLLLQHQSTYAYEAVALNLNRTERVAGTHSLSAGIPQDENWVLQQVADYNQDGNVDLIVRHKADGRWKGFLLNGQGNLVPGSRNMGMTKDINWHVVPTEQAEEDAIINDDFNGDGIPDVLMRNSNGIWWINHLNGNRGLAANSGGIAMIGDTNYQLKAKADFNNDGFEDVLVRNMNTGVWFMYHLNGARGFAANSGGVGLSTSLDWEFKTAEDFNGDGNVDILMRNSVTGGWWIYHMNGARGLAANSGGIALTTNASYEFTTAKDFNGDGNTDVLVRNSSTGAWYLYHLNGNRGFAAGSGGIGMSYDTDWEFKAAQDFNGDGNTDILVRNSATGGWWLYHLTGARGIGAGSGGLGLTTGAAWQFKAANDFNGDGNTDVLIRNSNGAWYLYHLNGNRGFAAGSGGVGMTTNGSWMYQ